MLSQTTYKAKYGKVLKILSPKQMFQRMPIVLAQVKAGYASENVLNKVRQIIHFLTIFIMLSIKL